MESTKCSLVYEQFPSPQIVRNISSDLGHFLLLIWNRNCVDQVSINTSITLHYYNLLS